MALVRERTIPTKLLYEYVEIKCQLDAAEVFIADLIACSACFGHHYAHHQELKSTRIIQWLLPVYYCMNIEKHNGIDPIKLLATSPATQRTDPMPVIESSHY